MSSKSFSRRTFIATSLQSSLTILGITFYNGACNTKESSQKNLNSSERCDDYSGIETAELEKRKQFAYVNPAPDSNKQCNSCKLFLPPKPGEKCGGCMLFKGPVEQGGSCTYWAPLD